MKKNKANKYVFIVIFLFILIFLSPELKNLYSKSENILPTTPIDEIPDILILEKDQINEIFSEDIDIDSIKEEYNNQETVGRLEIPGVFNLIISQAKDNEYYTYYNIYKKRDVKGSEFLDFRNKVEDKQINIYGHNSTTYDVPFKKIEKFLDEDFFNNNQYILFQHKNGRRIYQIASIKKVDQNSPHMKLNPENRQEHINSLTTDSINSRNLDYSENTNIIVLQTCVTRNSGNYYILVGFEI